MANGGGRKDGRMEGNLEIPPCVLKDISLLGPLPKKAEARCESPGAYKRADFGPTVTDFWSN